MPTKKDLWTREDGTHVLEYKGRTYKNMVLFSRPCATCGEKFGIHVTEQVADGRASSNNFALKNCEKHRQRAGNSADPQEIKKLSEQLSSVNSYCATLERDHKTQFEELQVVKARLAKYELGPAMEQHATNGVVKESLTFPWRTD